MIQKKNGLKKGLIVVSWYNKNTQTAHYYVYDIALDEKVIPEKVYRGLKTSKNVLAFLAICEAFRYLIKNKLKLKIYSSNKFAIVKAKENYINTTQSDKRMKKLVREAIPSLHESDVEGKLKVWETGIFGKDEYYRLTSEFSDFPF